MRDLAAAPLDVLDVADAAVEVADADAEYAVGEI